MAHVCEICNKGELSGNNVSHSHLKSEVKRINVCTRCLRSGKVERAL